MTNDDSAPELSPGYWVAGPCGSCSGADVECMDRMRRCIRRFVIIDRVVFAVMIAMFLVAVLVVLGGGE